MKRRSLPGLWLMTDTARGDAKTAMLSLPRGSGVIFRDYDRPDREALGAELRRLARQRGLMFLVAGDARLARRLGADGLHLPENVARQWSPSRARPLAQEALRWIVTAASHGRRGMVSAQRAGVDAVFLSPVFPTRSHPGARTLGPVRFAALAHAANRPVFALGGVTAETWRRLRGSGASGYGAIDALQKPSENSVNRISASRSPT